MELKKLSVKIISVLALMVLCFATIIISVLAATSHNVDVRTGVTFQPLSNVMGTIKGQVYDYDGETATPRTEINHKYSAQFSGANNNIKRTDGLADPAWVMGGYSGGTTNPTGELNFRMNKNGVFSDILIDILIENTGVKPIKMTITVPSTNTNLTSTVPNLTKSYCYKQFNNGNFPTFSDGDFNTTIAGITSDTHMIIPRANSGEGLSKGVLRIKLEIGNGAVIENADISFNVDLNEAKEYNEQKKVSTTENGLVGCTAKFSTYEGGTATEPAYVQNMTSELTTTSQNISSVDNLVIKFTITEPTTNSAVAATVTIGEGEGASEKTYALVEPKDPSNPNVRVLTIPASEITDNISVTATAKQTVNVTLSGTETGTYYKIKSVNGTVGPGGTTATISKGVDATIVVEGVGNHSLSNKIQVTINGRNSSNQLDVTSGAVANNGVSYNKNVNDNNWTISIAQTSLTEDVTDVTITCPTYVKGNITEGAFADYQCITFDNAVAPANGRWIIIGAGSSGYGHAVTGKDGLGSGQVLLLSENCILDENNTVIERVYDNENHKKGNWSTSDIRAYLNGISINGNAGTSGYANKGFYQNSGLSGYKVVEQSLNTIWYSNQECSTDDNMFLLALRGGKFSVQTYLTTDAKRDIDVGWWLRSGHNTNDDCAYSVYIDGSLWGYCNVFSGTRGVRPAFVLDLNDIPAPTGLCWDKGVAHWDESSLAGGGDTTYSVQLYKKNADNVYETVGTAQTTATNSHDFSTAIRNTNAGGGAGEYTFTVQAISGDTHSAVSGHSQPISAYSITTEAATGVSSYTITVGSDTVSVAINGEIVRVDANYGGDYYFDQWTITGNPTFTEDELNDHLKNDTAIDRTPVDVLVDRNLTFKSALGFQGGGSGAD